MSGTETRHAGDHIEFREFGAGQVIGRQEIHYASAPPPAPTSFASLLASHQDIVRGEHIWQRLQAFLDDPVGGALLVSGPPGTGKTAILANLIMRDESVPHYFFSRSRGLVHPDDCIATLLRRVRMRHGLDDDPWAPEPLEQRKALRSLLENLSRSGVAETIVVDGLDEAEGADGLTILQILPCEPLEHIHWIFGCREGTPVCPLAENRCGANRVRLTRDDEWNLTDAEAYLRARLGPIGADETLCRWLAEQGEANFLYLHYFVERAIEEGRVAPDLPGFLERTEGPMGMYEEWWENLRGRLDAETHALAGDVLACCAAAGRPLTVRQIGELLEVRARSLRPALEHVNQFLPEHEADGEHWRSFYHESFREFCREEFRDDLFDYHRALVFCCEEWRRAGDGHLRSFALHLPDYQLAVRDWDGLAATLSDPVFLEDKCADEGFGVFELIRDFNRALRGDGAPEEPRQAILAWSRFVRSHSHVLAKQSDLLLPAAYNSAAAGPVPEAAERLLTGRRAPWLRSRRRPDAPLSACIQTLAGHDGGVLCVALTSDGLRAVTGSDDATTRVWELGTGECLRVLEGHQAGVYGVSLAADGRRAVTASADATVRLWDLWAGECLRTLAGHEGEVWSVAATADGKQAVTGGCDRSVRVWDLTTGECLHALEGHDDWIRGVAVTPDGRYAATASYDGSARVWDLPTGKCLRTLEEHEGAVRCVALTPDGERVVTGDSVVARVWDSETGECLSTLEGHESWVRAVALAPDAGRAVTGSDDLTARVWNLTNGECLRTLQGHKAVILSVALTEDAQQAVTASFDHTARVWDLGTDEFQCVPEKHSGSVWSVALTGDGKQAVTGGDDPGGDDHTVRMWDLATCECVRTLDGPQDHVWCVALTPEGEYAVTGSDAVQVWDLATGECVRTLAEHEGSVWCVAVTPDGRWAVAGSGGPTARVWDLKTGECVRTLEGHEHWVRAVALTPDGSQALTGGFDRTARVWDLAAGECVQILEGHEGYVWSVAVSADGKRAITGSVAAKVWDLATGRCLHTLVGHERWIRAVALASEGGVAVTASDDHTVRVWDLTSGTETACFCAEGGVYSCAMADDGTIVAGDAGGNVHFLEVTGGAPD